MDQKTSAASPCRPIPRAYRHDAREGAYLGTHRSSNGNTRGSEATSGEPVARDTAGGQCLDDEWSTVPSTPTYPRTVLLGVGHAPALACRTLHVDRGLKRYGQRANGRRLWLLLNAADHAAGSAEADMLHNLTELWCEDDLESAVRWSSRSTHDRPGPHSQSASNGRCKQARELSAASTASASSLWIAG